MKKIKIFSSLFLLLVVFESWSQEVKMEKRYEQHFLVSTLDRVSISNKYGEVIVNTWYSDSVKINVSLVAEGKNQDAVNKLMGRVNVNLRKVGDLVLGQTHFDRGTGFFNELAGQIGDYSKSLLKTNKVKIDYEIWVPEKIDVSIENKFGDVYLASAAGEVTLDLSHGDLRANRIEDQIYLKHSFGKAHFDYIKKGDLTLRGSDIRIRDGDLVEIESSSSELSLDKIGTLQMNSRNDDYDVETARHVVGQGTFTDLEIDFVEENLKLDFSYGDVFLTRIEKEFESIYITGKSTDINLILDQASYIKTEIKGPDQKMILPNSMLLMQKETLADKRISLSGFVGNTNRDFSQLDIDAQGGELIISIKEMPIFTDRD